MKTLSMIKQENMYKSGASSLLSNNQKNTALSRIEEKQKLEEESSKNKGGFFGGLGYTFEKLGLGFLSSIEGIWDYSAGGLAKLFGADDWAEQQFANDWVDYNHADDWYNPTEGWKVAGDIAGGIGTSLPAIVTVAAAGAIAVASGGTLSPVAAGLISAGIAGLGAAGNATKEAYQQTGELSGKEFGYGALVGVTEGAIEGISAGIGVGTGQVVKNISKSFGKEIATSATRQTLGKAIVKGFIGEAFEEGVAELVSPVWARLTYDPNAKDATFQEIGYAALIGGLSGAIMGGADVSLRNIASTARGSKIAAENKQNGVLEMARELSVYEKQNNTQLESFELVNNVYNELQASMKKTNGTISTVKQKMLLGVLEKANTTAVFSPIVNKSAMNIVNNAEVIAERLTAFGYTDAKGNPLQFTAEQIRQGVDMNNPKSFSKALKTNDILRSLAVADATGQISINAAKFKESVLMGQQLSSQVDLNRFIETATESELQAVGEKLGIDNWETITNDQLLDKITQFVENDGVETYKKERLIIREAENIAPDTARNLPKVVNMTADGAARFILDDSQMAIIKEGNIYRTYDYTSKRLSKPLTKQELNKLIRQINKQRGQVAAEVTKQLEQESELKKQAAELDSYARENISNYNNLSAANQSMVRAVIRQGRAAGVSEDFVLTAARVAARSGLNIVFNKEASFVAANGTFADGAIDLKNNRIIINPESKNRTGEMILIHELTHAIYNLQNGVLQVAEGLETMSAEEKQAIRKRYSKIGKSGIVEISDEINAHFAEQTLSNKNILERLVAKKPTVKEKILNFFKSSSKDYKEDVKLTGAANKLFKQYKKLFDEFSARNQGTNAVETTKTNQSKEAYALAKDEKSGYNNKQLDGIEEKDIPIKLQNAIIDYTAKDINNRLKAIQSSIKHNEDLLREAKVPKNLIPMFEKDLKELKNEERQSLLQQKAIEDQTRAYNNNNQQKWRLPEPYSERLREISQGFSLQENSESIGFLVSVINYAKLYKTYDLRKITDGYTVGNLGESIRIVDPSCLPRNLIDIKEENSEFGIRTWFFVDPSYQSVDVGGFYVPTTDKMFLLLDEIAPLFNTTNRHEKTHYFESEYPELYKAYKNEIGKVLTQKEKDFLYEKYYSGYKKEYDSIPVSRFEDYIWGEVYANIYSLKDISHIKNKQGIYKVNEEFDARLKSEFGIEHEIMYALPEEDSNGNKLSENQRKFFADSKVVDENGKLLPVYHGTGNNNFTIFDIKKSKSTGLLGQGFYFTSNLSEATEKYAKKNGRVISAYLNIKKPLEVDLVHKSSIISKLRDEFGGTFDVDYYVYSARYRDRVDTKRLLELIRKQGYDGIINKQKGYYVALDSNQIKETTNTSPTSDNDIRYAIPNRDSYGDALSDEQVKYFKNSSVLDESGRLLVLYHQTGSEFTVFDTNKQGAGHSDYEMPHGIFLKPTAANIGLKGDKQMRLYANITRPLVFMNREQAQSYWRQNIEGYDSIINEIADNDKKYNELFEEYFSEKRLARRKGLQFSELTDEQLDSIIEESTKMCDEVLKEWRSENSKADKRAKELIDNYLQDSGYDGIHIFEDRGSFGRSVETWIALKPNQVKNTSNFKPTNDDDIRYALIEVDSENNTLSSEQIEYFKKSKVVDDLGRLQIVYHGTNNNFFTFNKALIGTNTNNLGIFGNGFYFTNNKTLAKTYNRKNGSLAKDGSGQIMELYINIEKPFIYTDKNAASIAKDLSFPKNRIKNNVLLPIVNAKDILSFTKSLKDSGYDGVIYDYGDGTKEYVVFDPNQIKRVDNKKPTLNDDIRFALQEDENQAVGGLSKAQRAKFVANNTRLKVYSKLDATEVINSIIDERLVLDDKYGVLSKKDKNAVIDRLFTKLNNTSEGYRSGVALSIADYIIERTVLQDMYDTADYSDEMRVLTVLRSYMHNIDLSGIQGEIRHKYDTKNSINLVWGSKTSKQTPDTIAQELAEEGIFIDAINEADIFFQMIDRYESAKRTVNERAKTIRLKNYGSESKIQQLRQEIAKDILLAYDEKGTQSKYGKLVDKYTEKIKNLKEQVKDISRRNILINNVLDRAQRMKELKLGIFLNATAYKSDIFKQSIEKLTRVKYRGNLNATGTRAVMADLLKWYTRENPFLEDCFNEDVEFMLEQLAGGSKVYSNTDLEMLRNVMSYFVTFVENYNRVYKQGKWIEAIPEAERYIKTIHNNENLKVGLLGKITESSYMQTFGDPMTVARRMDRYENGFFSDMMIELRDASIDAEVSEMEIKQKYNEFLTKNKKYVKNLQENVTYKGVEIPKAHLIGLYMTMKREQAHAGLVLSGFSFIDKKGKKIRVPGFATGASSEADILTAVEDERVVIDKLLSATDKEYISILEVGYNQDAKKLKADRDMQRLGYTNAQEDYYYPIRRGNIAKNVDTSEFAAELDRVSNASFNKDTVKGAKQELFIESADTVYNRHIKAVTKYAYLSPAIDTFNRLYNLDISGDRNKPISVATESQNTWSKGKQYFSKLISDIQGIPSSSSEGMKLLSFLRGSYAKFQLGANPKVWVTQLSSIFASSSILETNSIIKGMTVSAKDVDIYCPLAKLRNSDNAAAMAQGVLDRVGKVGNVLMAPIGKVDRFVVKRLFGACQVQVQKNTGAKIGTTANKIEAGKLLKKVILETQQNSISTERSAAMRSGNEILRTVTMFSADSMKVIGRVIDSFGELGTLKTKLKQTKDTQAQAKIKAQIKIAEKKCFKSVIALVTSAAFMAGVAKLFRWLYDKEDDKENSAETVIVDFVGNLFGGLPLIRDVYSRLVEGYSLDNYAYSALNDLLDSAASLISVAEKLMSGNASQQDIAKSIKQLSYAAGQILGIPTRNIYNIAYGLTKRVSPTSAYKIDNVFYKKNYLNDLKKAIEDDDIEMISMLLNLVLDERTGGDYSENTLSTLRKLYSSGYSVLPKSVGDSISYNGEEISLSESQKTQFKKTYSQANAYVDKMILTSNYKMLSEENKAKAIKQVFDAYYAKAVSETLGVENNNNLLTLSKYISIDTLSPVFVGLSLIESDKDSSGKTITGSKKKKVIKYLLTQNLSDEQRLFILAYKGYSIQDKEFRGYSEKIAKNKLLKFILGLKTATQAEKAKLAQICGFEVKNGKIISQTPFNVNK
ncbi:MAG: hypothetical protein E7345_01380 [Clostridiales bacterium]|nr:hypothetical protein [Clostridiales bacterium]